ncbi:uncharacterized protein LOC133310620 [Gastrolobium bilobum]|uniref:uncharacterized protein LOC133310620 n=1 Tax=Gastrolobium bilobum TaxID=150636 RepID=UPI002AB17AB2|nr:uncharacterized protein LOC133310620 [Gastrolobium bilobum]
MMAQDVADPIACRLFPTTLKETALRWYSALPLNSVQSWEDLTNQFLIRFATSKAQYKSTHALKTVRQGSKETLRDYLNRFFDEALLVIDLDPQVSLHIITEGLVEGPFSMLLAKQRPRTIEELRARSEKFINLEDYKRSREISNTRANTDNFERDIQKSFQRKFREKRKWGKYDNYTPLNTSQRRILKEVFQTGYVRVNRPPPMPQGVQRDETKFCEFHNDKGHTTDECFALKNTIEALIREGKLHEFISSCREYKALRRRDRSPDHDPNSNEQRAYPRRNYNPARNNDQRRATLTDRRQGTPPRNRQRTTQQQRDGLPNNAAGVLATIAGGLAGRGATKSQRKKHLKSIMTVRDHALHSTSRSQRQAISFDNDDYGDIIPDHDDPLVISACMVNLQVKRIMVDNGSSADIIFLDAFRAMHISEEHLLHGCSDLIGFAGECVQPKGTIEI